MTALVVRPQDKPLRGLLPPLPDRLTATVAVAAGLAVAHSETQLRGRGLPRLEILDVARQLGAEVHQDEHGLSVRPPASLARGDLQLDGCSYSLAAVCGLFAGTASSRRVGITSCDPALLFAMATGLRARGASMEGTLDPNTPRALHPPLELGGGSGCVEAMLQVTALEVKLALLMTCFSSRAPLVLQEAPLGDDRPERVLAEAGLLFHGAGPVVQVMAGNALHAPSGTLPGDPEAASFLLAAALGQPGSVVGVRNVISNPATSGWLDELQRSGLALQREAKSSHLGQATADVTLGYGLRRDPLVVAGESAQRSPLGLMAWALLAAQGSPHKESRLWQLPGSVDETSELLSRFGVHHRRLDSGLGVAGCEKPTACTFRAHSAEGAMAACVLALRADGLSRIEGAETLVARFPRFVASMRALGANMEVESQS